jgi:hypothetical protein
MATSLTAAPGTTVTVMSTPCGDRAPAERSYEASEFHIIGGGALAVTRDPIKDGDVAGAGVVAVYAPGAWMCARAETVEAAG